MKRYSRKNKRPKNRSLKNSPQPTIVPIKYYSKNFKNTKLIPKTQIIDYMFSGYNDFLFEKKLSDELGVYSLSLEKCFIIEQNSMPSGLRSDSINLTLKMNPDMSLDKLIAYSFYLKQSYIFEKKEEEALVDIKYQIGKDIERSNRKINGKLYDAEYYQKFGNKYAIADRFYQNIIDDLFKIDYKYVNLNVANKFALLSCQNVFNLITDLITLKLNSILEPETNSVFNASKNIDIIINRYELSMDLSFKSDLIISRDGEQINPEYPCGRLEFNLFIDILNSKYELKKFILTYDIDKCGPEKIIEEPQQLLNEEPSIKTNFKAEYVVPASLITAGIVATPILLTTLGGKKHTTFRKKRKHRKTRKNRR